MRKTFQISFFGAVVLNIFIAISSCKSKEQAAAGHSIITGKTVALTDQKIGETGILYVDKPGDSLSGLLMYVSDAAFASSRRFRMSYAPITSHTFGPDFNPISPLITISCGGGFSDSIVTMEIPIHLPEGKFAMGFLYDERTGKLEGMPLLKLEKDRAVVAFRNFEHSVSRGSAMAAQVAGADAEPVTKIVMSAVDEKKLRLDKYDSGFRPGVDDVPSTNWGSALMPDGHCSGQSQLMMWYYANKKKNGASGLYSFLEADGGPPTPGFWQDDTKAIRLSSLLQNAEENISFFKQELSGLIVLGGMFATDLMTLYAFSYAIRLTHEPQYISIREDWNVREGHAILVYKIEDYVLYIADPNNPGNKTRRIIFDDKLDKFLYYRASVNAGAPGKDYKAFTYMGTTSLLSNSVIEKCWKDMEDGTLGQNKFPAYTIKVYNNKEFVPFEDGFTTEEDGDVLSFAVECAVPAEIVAYEETATLPVISKNVKKGDQGNYITESTFRVTAGEHRIGIYVRDLANIKWIGFKRAKIKIVDKEAEKPLPPDLLPVEGYLNAELYVNRQTIILEGLQFHARNTNGSSNFSIWGNAKDLRHNMEITSNTFNGEGEYNDASASFSSSINDDTYGTYVNQKNDAQLIITKWGEGKLEGAFTFDAYDNYYKKTVTVRGQFKYKIP
ncbi:MAG: hypothetical protein HZB42_14395 [Sphingobacteriales bacterium]|nr:hypothetical protein [Sphingobacteriales bacterium]